MSYTKPIFFLLTFCLFISSCKLFGGDNGKSQVKRGKVVWSVKNKEILTVSTQPAIDDNRVFFIQNAQLKAYSLDEGTQIWNKQLCEPGRTCDYSRTIVQNDNHLFIDKGFNIIAFNKSDGSIMWETDITNDGKEVSGIGSPIMSQDATYLYAGRKGYVLKLRKSDGKVVRRFPLDHMVPEGIKQGSTEPIISPFDDNHLYLPTNYFNPNSENPTAKGNIFSFDASSGVLQWSYKIPNHYHKFTLPNGQIDSTIIRSAVFDASVTQKYVVVLTGASVITLDRLSGKKVWETFFSGDQQDGFDVGMAIKENAIYIASSGFFATKLDLNTGKILWRHYIKFSNTSIPTVQNGRFYFNNSGGGGIWVLNTTDGSVIFNEEPPNHQNDDFDVYISSLGVGEGYMVDVGSKAVYCLKVP